MNKLQKFIWGFVSDPSFKPEEHLAEFTPQEQESLRKMMEPDDKRANAHAYYWGREMYYPVTPRHS